MDSNDEAATGGLPGLASTPIDRVAAVEHDPA